MNEMSDYTPFERLGVRNGLNRVVGPFVSRMEQELTEAILSIKDREVPNVDLCLRRLEMISKLLSEVKGEQQKWNEEL